MKLLVAVISCKTNKYLWDKFLEKKLDNVIIVCGEPKLETKYLLQDNILYLRCNDFYEGLPCKIISLVEAIISIDKFNDITHVMKADDNSTSFDGPVLKRLERNKDVGTRDYTGQQLNTEGGYRRYHWGKCSKGSYWDEKEYYGDYVNWLDGGSTYILSRRAMISINKTYKMEDLEEVHHKHIFEDVMIALILSKYKMYPHEVKYKIGCIK